MRTTLTLDPDVAAGLEHLQQERGLTFKAAVNDALRKGLRALREPPDAPREPYRVRPWSAGAVRIENIDDVSEALATAEGEAFR